MVNSQFMVQCEVSPRKAGDDSGAMIDAVNAARGAAFGISAPKRVQLKGVSSSFCRVRLCTCQAQEMQKRKCKILKKENGRDVVS
jgi:hypothetical protein